MTAFHRDSIPLTLDFILVIITPSYILQFGTQWTNSDLTDSIS